jgi:hypothetical protein
MVSTYRADAGRLEPFSQGLGNLFEASINRNQGMSPEMQAMALRARKDREDAEAVRAQQEALARAAGLFEGEYNPRAFGGAAIAAGLSPEVANLLQARGGIEGALLPEQRANLYMGAGNALSPTDSFSLADQQAERERVTAAQLNQALAEAQAQGANQQELARLNQQLGSTDYIPNLSQVQGQLAREGDVPLADLFGMENPQRAAQADYYRAQTAGQLAENMRGPEAQQGPDPLNMQDQRRIIDLEADLLGRGGPVEQVLAGYDMTVDQLDAEDRQAMIEVALEAGREGRPVLAALEIFINNAMQETEVPQRGLGRLMPGSTTTGYAFQRQPQPQQRLPQTSGSVNWEDM